MQTLALCFISRVVDVKMSGRYDETMDGPFLEALRNWLVVHRGVITGITAASMVFFVLTPVAVPVLLVRMAPDALVREKAPPTAGRFGRRFLGWFWSVLRNLFGIALILLGFILLFVPGQGLLTMLAGVALADVPGKRLLILKIVSKPAIRRGIEKLRARHGRPPLIIPE